MAPSPLLLIATLLSSARPSSAFVVPEPPTFGRPRLGRAAPPPASRLAARRDPDLFEDEEEMIPIAEAYVHAKYRQCAREHGHECMTSDDAREVLRGLLPPVTPEELDDEVSKTLDLIMENPSNSAEKIDEDDFVRAIVRNSYWKSAGNLVVKELMYFDALHSYYRTGSSLLNNDDYDELHENLTWEGSSVATMSKNEALFVTAVASARRGEPILDDAEYNKLKDELKAEGSWVAEREQDALEKMGINTFMGYLHRAL